jgi:hypothetical protein
MSDISFYPKGVLRKTTSMTILQRNEHLTLQTKMK